MADMKINLNGETVPFTIFVAGTQANPDIHIDYDSGPGWPTSVIITNIADVEIWQSYMVDAFNQCGADTTKITFEAV